LRYLDSETALHESLMREQRERLNRALPVLLVNGHEPCVSPDPACTPASAPNSDWLEGLLDRLEIAITGGLREDPDEFQKRIISAPHPEYPALAQRAGIQGVVRLQVRVTKDGRVEVQKVLEGEPVLADAAIMAVKQWQANPAWVSGKKVEVISTVKFNFQLH
jgi:TonB family protein